MYKHDIFLSYARRNNVAGWVTEFRLALENVLREKPDVQQVEIFVDEKDIGGGEAFDERICNSLSKSAVLVIIVSEASLDAEREWCHRERQEFIRQAGGEERVNGRIFLVNYDGIDPARLPADIRRFTPYNFFERDRTTDDTRPGTLLEAGTGRFHSALYSLRRDLIDALVRLDAPAIRREAELATVQTIREASHGSGPTVFLAEVIPGKTEQDWFTQIESALMQRVKVVPGRRSYFAAQEGFEEEIDAFLRQSNLFVQLLSAARWPASHNFEHGYERWLYERAKKIGIPILRWRSGSMDLQCVADNDYLEFLNSDEPSICDLSEFIPQVFNELEKQQTRRKFKTGTEAHPVLLMADRSDEALCDEVGARIEEMGSNGGGYALEPEMVLLSEDDGVDVVADADSLSPKGLVVVWDRGPEARLQSLLKHCRRYRRSRELDPPACAIVVPSGETHVVKRRPPRFPIISSQNQSELKKYVLSICGESV